MSFLDQTKLKKTLGKSWKLGTQTNQPATDAEINYIYTPFKSYSKKSKKETKRLQHILSRSKHPSKQGSTRDNQEKNKTFNKEYQEENPISTNTGRINYYISTGSKPHTQ